MISTSDFRTGIVIKYENGLYEIIDFQLVKMQQRQPIVRTKLRNIRTGSALEQPFRSGDRFEEVYLEKRPIQYLYHEGGVYHFMDSETYNEVVAYAKMLGEQVNFLKENTEVTGCYGEDELIMLELPASVVLEVSQTNPGLRGDTAKSGTKLAKVETGASVKVPFFVNTGDKVRVDTRTGQYLERA